MQAGLAVPASGLSDPGGAYIYGVCLNDGYNFSYSMSLKDVIPVLEGAKPAIARPIYRMSL